MASTPQQRGDSWRIGWRLGGSRTGAWQSCTFKGPTLESGLRLAETAKALVESRGHNITRAECYDAILGKEDVDPRIPTFKQWVGTYIDDRARMRDIQPDVLKVYQQILTSRAVPYMGHLRLTDINHDVLRDWVAHMSASRITIGSKNRRTGDRLLAGTTIRRVHGILHTCLGAAVPKWLPANPAARQAGSSKFAVGLPKKSNFEGMFLTEAEIRMILDHCDEHVRDMVDVAVHTGLRLGELVALEARKVVFDRDGLATILVHLALKNDGEIGEPKSEMSRRAVPVGPRLSKLLAARVQGRKMKALVFSSPFGGMWDPHNFRHRYWYRAVAAAMRCVEHPPAAPMKPRRGPTRQLRHDEVSECLCRSRLQRRPRFHDLRHTHASDLIRRGWHAKKIQRRLGHATYQTTMNIYGHLMDNGDSTELEALERPMDALLAAPEVSRVSAHRRRSELVRRRAAPAACRRLLVPRSSSGRVAVSSRRAGHCP